MKMLGGKIPMQGDEKVPVSLLATQSKEVQEGDPGTTHRSRLLAYAPALLTFLWPLAYFYRFVVPDRPFSLALGNDFVWLYYRYKVYLLDLLAGGHFPLWSPSEAAGFPFYSSPFTQAAYPLNALLLGFYDVVGGYSVFDHQTFTVLGLCLYGLGLYLWLCRLETDRRGVMVAVLIMTVSFKTAELVRFPNAVHAAAWMPWLLYGITLASEEGKKTAACTVLFVSTIMLLTAGYPYYAYYCLFLHVPYAAALLFRPSRELLIGQKGVSINRKLYLLAAALPVIAAGLVCSPYLLKMQGLLSETTDRAGKDYAYSTSYPFAFPDTVGSLIFPPAAQPEGWYYFSIVGVLLLCLYIASAITAKESASAKRRFLFLMLLWCAVISSISYGRDSYLFDFLWHHLPGFSQLRAWGRINIVLVPLIALCLARAYSSFERTVRSIEDADLSRRVIKLNLVALTLTAALIFAGQIALYRGGSFHSYWMHYFAQFHGQEDRFIVNTVTAFLVLSGIHLVAMVRPIMSQRALTAVIIIVTATAVVDMRPVGSQQWAYTASETCRQRAPARVAEAIARSLETPRFNIRETISLDARFNAGFIWNWYFSRYTAFHNRFYRGDDAFEPRDPESAIWFERLLGMTDGNRFFLSSAVSYESVEEFIEDADETRRRLDPAITVQFYNGDRLELDVTTGEACFLSFIDNWDPAWRASVNGRPVEIHKLFGTFKSVALEAGESSVVFAYRPFRTTETAH